MKKNIVKNTERWNRWHEYKYLLWGAIGFLVFPLVIGFIYHLPLPQYINVDSGDLLAYYGTVFGLFSSAATFYINRKEEQKKRQKQNRPDLFLTVNKHHEQPDKFTVIIENHTENRLDDVHFYDIWIGKHLPKESTYTVYFDKEGIVTNIVDHTLNIIGANVLEEDGYPEYFQIVCDDCDGIGWVVDFLKRKQDGFTYYYPVMDKL